jgi:hypothetical protein
MEIDQADRIYRKIKGIQGWFLPHACRLFALLDGCQKQQGVTGNLFEIGVWHGKSAVLIAAMLQANELLGTCDIFDDYGADGQSAKLTRFQRNMERHFGNTPFLRIYSKSSRDLTREDLTSNCRIIHVDAAHDSCNVYEDLVLAESCLHDQGAIIMDDAYQLRWPGVTDGIYRFLYTHPDQLVPLVCGFNKLVLVRPNADADYVDRLTDSTELKARVGGAGPYVYKVESIMGHPVHCYFDRPQVQAAFFPRLTTAAFKRFPWLRNPATRQLNRWIKKIRGG